MKRNSRARLSEWPGASTVARRDVATCPPSASPGDSAALLQLAVLEADLYRLRQSMAALLAPLARHRSELAALTRRIERDRPHGAARELGKVLAAGHRRLLRTQRTHAGLANALDREEAEVLAVSSKLRRTTARLAQERGKLLGGVSAPLREHHEAAVREGQLPALVAVQDGRCPGCGKTLADASQWLIEASPCVLPCRGCLRLLYDRGWAEREPLRPTIPRVTSAKP